MAIVAGTALAVGPAGPAHGDNPSFSGRSTVTSSSDKALANDCGPDRLAIGAGAGVKDGGAQVGLSRLAWSPFGKVTAVATEDDTGFAGGWSLQIGTACHLPPVGWEVMTAAGAAGSATQRVATVKCRPGMRVYSAGGGVLGGQNNVVLEGLRIAPDLTSVTVTAAEDDNGFAGAWSANAQAVCGRPHTGQTRRAATTAVDSAATKTAVATCLTGEVHGVGGEITGGGGQVRILAIADDSLSGGVRITAIEDEDGYAGNWSATAYAVCAP
jgi:hypothetical protein